MREPNCQNVAHRLSSAVMAPLLSMRGTLCWPPTLPRARSQAANPPRGMATTSGGNIVRFPARCAA